MVWHLIHDTGKEQGTVLSLLGFLTQDWNFDLFGGFSQKFENA